MKYTNEIRNAIAKEISNPSDEFVKYFAKPVYPGRFYDDIFDQFREIVKQAFKQYMTDYVNERLKSAISPDVSIPAEVQTTSADENPTCECEDSKIVTTEEEMQGFYIVRAILYNKIDDINRVAHRDTQSYFGILLDDNNRKPICRLLSTAAISIWKRSTQKKEERNTPLNRSMISTNTRIRLFKPFNITKHKIDLLTLLHS